MELILTSDFTYYPCQISSRYIRFFHRKKCCRLQADAGIPKVYMMKRLSTTPLQNWMNAILYTIKISCCVWLMNYVICIMRLLKYMKILMAYWRTVSWVQCSRWFVNPSKHSTEVRLSVWFGRVFMEIMWYPTSISMLLLNSYDCENRFTWNQTVWLKHWEKHAVSLTGKKCGMKTVRLLKKLLRQQIRI